MKNVLGYFFILTAICSAQEIGSGTDNANVVTRMSSDEISDRIREELTSRGIRLDDVTRAAREQRGKTRMARQTVTPQAVSTNALSDRDQATVDRIVNVFNRVYQVYSDMKVLDSPPALYYSTDPTINASAQNGNQVVVYLGLAELLQDSDSELAMAVAHELGHIVQQRYNSFLFVPDNAEFDADVWGTLVSLFAGYDPYAGSGTLAKLSMVTGDVGLVQQYEDQLASDAHKSFVSRIQVMYVALKAVCSANADTQNACNEYRSTVHPHFPLAAVL